MALESITIEFSPSFNFKALTTPRIPPAVLVFTCTLDPDNQESVRQLIDEVNLEFYSGDRWADDGGPC